MAELWFLVRTVDDDHWACAGEPCVYGGREKSGESLEMVENGVEGYFKRKSFYKIFETYGIFTEFLNSWYFTEVLKPMVFYRGS